MNGLISSVNLGGKDCPISLPLTLLEAGNTGVAFGHVLIQPGEMIRIRYLGLHFSGFTTLGGSAKVNSGLPQVYAGLYYGNFQKIGKPTGSPVLKVGLESPGYATLDLSTWSTACSPGNYTWLLVNNSASRQALALVTGAFKL